MEGHCEGRGERRRKRKGEKEEGKDDTGSYITLSNLITWGYNLGCKPNPNPVPLFFFCFLSFHFFSQIRLWKDHTNTV